MMTVLMVVESDTRELTYVEVAPQYLEVVRAADGKNFNSRDEAVDALVEACGGGDGFDPALIGTEVSSPVGAAEFCTFWLNE